MSYFEYDNLLDEVVHNQPNKRKSYSHQKLHESDGWEFDNLKVESVHMQPSKKILPLFKDFGSLLWTVTEHRLVGMVPVLRNLGSPNPLVP